MQRSSESGNNQRWQQTTLMAWHEVISEKRRGVSGSASAKALA
jgi:hypothetical protein